MKKLIFSLFIIFSLNTAMAGQDPLLDSLRGYFRHHSLEIRADLFQAPFPSWVAEGQRAPRLVLMSTFWKNGTNGESITDNQFKSLYEAVNEIKKEGKDILGFKNGKEDKALDYLKGFYQPSERKSEEIFHILSGSFRDALREIGPESFDRATSTIFSFVKDLSPYHDFRETYESYKTELDELQPVFHHTACGVYLKNSADGGWKVPENILLSVTQVTAEKTSPHHMTAYRIWFESEKLSHADCFNLSNVDQVLRLFRN